MLKLNATFLVVSLAIPIQAMAGPPFPPRTNSALVQYPGCPDDQSSVNNATAIDISQPVDEDFLRRAKESGVTVILRYYDWKDRKEKLKDQCAAGKRTAFNEQFKFPWKLGPTIRGKTLTAGERDLIFDNKLSIGVVFQHCNDNINTFRDIQ